MSESTTSKEKNCTFTFKKRRGGAGVRRKAVETNSSSEEETVVNRVEKKSSAGPLSARTVSSSHSNLNIYPVLFQETVSYFLSLL